MDRSRLKELYHRPLRRLGIDVIRFDPGSRRLASLLQRFDISVVLDVGANSGQYAAGIRRRGFTGRIESFEPMAAPFRTLSLAAARDPQWRAWPLALGDVAGTSTINVAQNSVSSSLLPMSDRLVGIEPTTAPVAEESVEVRTLDDVFAEVCRPSDRVFLKLDVQGFERQVLDGASASLPAITGLQLEMALVPLYDGAMVLREALDRAAGEGFELAWLEPGFHTSDGQLLECDGVFFRGLNG